METQVEVQLGLALCNAGFLIHECDDENSALLELLNDLGC